MRLYVVFCDIDRSILSVENICWFMSCFSSVLRMLDDMWVGLEVRAKRKQGFRCGGFVVYTYDYFKLCFMLRELWGLGGD